MTGRESEKLEHSLQPTMAKENDRSNGQPASLSPPTHSHPVEFRKRTSLIRFERRTKRTILRNTGDARHHEIIRKWECKGEK